MTKNSKRFILWILVAFLIQPFMVHGFQTKSKVTDIGSRLELFVDDYLIDEISGKASLILHHPDPREIVLVHDEPWEGSGSGYHSVFQDEGIYRMYYKAWQHTASDDLATVHPLFCAYAESKDGIHWVKPKLDLQEYEGSRDNNIVFISGEVDGFNLNAGHPAIFKDDNPKVSQEGKYKAILISGKPKHGLVAYQSPDGIHWKVMSNETIISDGAFDSQNLAFWDAVHNKYRAYWRYFTESDDESLYKGKRAIRTGTSMDFIHWDHQENIQFLDSPEEQLYTSQIKPYHRAPHILIGFPVRYIDRGWSPSMTALPELELREKRAEINQRYGTAITESLIMASRDGITFKRWNEAFIRPGVERLGSWTYGDSYMAWHVVETKSPFKGAPNELSFYVSENYWKGKASAVRRYTLRLDGFVSVSAPMVGGSLRTKPITFEGDNLYLNFSSSASGDVHVEILDDAGIVIPGFSRELCDPIFGDTVKRKVSWSGKENLSSLRGKTIRLRFIMKDADLYAFQFE